MAFADLLYPLLYAVAPDLHDHITRSVVCVGVRACVSVSLSVCLSLCLSCLSVCTCVNDGSLTAHHAVRALLTGLQVHGAAVLYHRVAADVDGARA
jgi:hypothetical protein